MFTRSILLLTALLAACDTEPPGRTIHGTAHEFDPNLTGLQRLWAQQVEQRLAAGLVLDENDFPVDVRPSATVTSATGAFSARISPLPDQVAARQRLRFELALTDTDGRSLETVNVQIAGGMPLHSHGLPTTPRVTSSSPGTYTVEGILYSMPGWWQLAVGIEEESSGRFDVVYFDFFVTP